MVLVVVDQLRHDTMDRLSQRLRADGFLRLRREGVELRNHWADYLPPSTSVGHATLATGAGPGVHGIVGNRWFDRREARLVESSRDDHGRYTTARLLVPTVGDLLRRGRPEARVLAISGKARAAMPMAGRRGLALWVDPLRAAPCSNLPPWLASPAWVQRFGKEHRPLCETSATWTPILPFPQDHPMPDDRPGEGNPACMGTCFPHPIEGCAPHGPKQRAHALLSSPMLDERTAALALAAIEGHGLADDEVPDLLMISFSSLDPVGHAFGPLSREAEDVVLRVDRLLARLLAALDRKPGAGSYALILTSDHGGPPAPGWMKSRGLQGGWIDLKTLAGKVEDVLSSRFGRGPWVLAARSTCLALDEARLKERGYPSEVFRKLACRQLSGVEGIERCIPRPELPLGAGLGPGWDRGDEIRRLYAASFHAERTWDIYLVPRRGWNIVRHGRRDGSTHSDPWEDSRRVPLWALAPWLEPARVRTRSQAEQVAPTLALWLGLDPLPDATSLPPPELLPARATGSSRPPKPRQPLHLVLLHSNDHHGGDMDHPVTGRKGPVGGLAMRAAMVDSIRRQVRGSRARVLLLDGGDVMTGPCEATLLWGRSSLGAMDLMGYDLMVLGNHEFDPPVDRLLGELDRVSLPVVSANVRWRSSGELLVKPYRLLDLAGYRVALLGLTTTETPRVSTRGNDPRLRFDDTLEAARSWVERLRPSADLLVLLTHVGIEQDLALARALPGIDIIVGGPSTTAPTRPLQEAGTLILQAGYFGQYLGRADLRISEQGFELLAYELLPVPAAGEQGELSPDPEVSGLLQHLWGSVAHRCAASAGKTSAPFSCAPLAGPGSGSTMIHLVTDAMRWRAQTDLALQNTGGVRDDLPAGEISMGMLRSALPFGNTIVRIELGGSELLDLLKEVAHRPPDSKSVLHGSGLSWRIAGKEPRDVLVAGTPLVPERQYTLATNSFLARGGDGYAILPRLRRQEDTGHGLAETVADYLRAAGPVSPDTRPRVVREERVGD